MIREMINKMANIKNKRTRQYIEHNDQPTPKKKKIGNAENARNEPLELKKKETTINSQATTSIDAANQGMEQIEQQPQSLGIEEHLGSLSIEQPQSLGIEEHLEFLGIEPGIETPLQEIEEINIQNII